MVAGGSLKLGMKFEGLAKGFPVLEDLLAGIAVLLEPADGSNGPIVRTDAVGRMPMEAGSAPQAQLEALVGSPLDALGIGIADVGTYATEIHNPEITEPQGGGDVPDRNYKMLAGLGVVHGELEKADIAGFARAHGLPGFSPTRAHRERGAMASSCSDAHAGRRSAPNDGDREGVVVPRPSHTAVGRRLGDPRSLM